jgi:hypothetical protein
MYSAAPGGLAWMGDTHSNMTGIDTMQLVITDTPRFLRMVTSSSFFENLADKPGTPLLPKKKIGHLRALY